MKKVNMFTVFVFAILLYLILSFISQFVWVHSYDEIYRVIQFLLVLLITNIVGVGACCIYQLRKSTNKNHRMFGVLSIVIIIFTSIYCVEFYEKGNGMQITSSTNIINKNENQNGECFITIKDTNGDSIILKCDKKNYERMIVDQDILYSIDYRKTGHIFKQAAIETISGTYVDNRYNHLQQ